MTFKSSAQSDDAPAVTSPVTRRRFRRATSGMLRGRTLDQHRNRNANGPILAALRAENAQLIDEETFADRPRTFGDCPDSGPCPYAGCKHHVYLDVNPESGAVKINFPDQDPTDIEEPCTLRLAMRGGLTLEDVGRRMNVTRERMRQIETQGLIRLKKRMPR